MLLASICERGNLEQGQIEKGSLLREGLGPQTIGNRSNDAKPRRGSLTHYHFFFINIHIFILFLLQNSNKKNLKYLISNIKFTIFNFFRFDAIPIF